MELVKELRELQEQILNREKEKYAKEKAIFESEESKTFGMFYIRCHEIGEFFFEDYSETLEGIVEICDEIKKFIAEQEERWMYKKIKTIPYKKEYCDEDWGWMDFFVGFKVVWYLVDTEEAVRTKAKRDFINEASVRVNKKAKELIGDKAFYIKNLDCFLLEKFMNEEIDINFLVEATYQGCKI